MAPSSPHRRNAPVTWDSPALSTARRRLDVMRSGAGRLATVVAAAVAIAGLFLPDLTGAAVLAAVGVSCAGVFSMLFLQPAGHQRVTATVLYAVPGVSLAALLITERIVEGVHPGEGLAVLMWAVGTWVLRPARVGRRLLTPAPRPVAPVPVPDIVDGHPAAQWWAQYVAIAGGAAPGTVLEDIELTGKSSMRAVIRSAKPGQPVPEVSIQRLSALIDVPRDLIDIDEVPGRGTSVQRLTIGKSDEVDPMALWTRRIAPAAMPGAVLTSIRIRPANLTSNPITAPGSAPTGSSSDGSTDATGADA